MTNNIPNPDDHNWDVFRYVAGEMSAGEESGFEQLLEHDQSLREEVAGMVAMLAKVDKAHGADGAAKVSLPDRSRAAKLRVRRLIVSAAALVLFAALAVALTAPGQQGSDSTSESIAIAWAESIDAPEFELPEQDDDFEFTSLDFEDDDDDWIVYAIAADDDPSIN